MAWDFETEPDFQEKLDWAAAFVREEVEPLDMLWPDLVFTPPDKRMRAVLDPLKDQVRAQGLWATHLGPELGGEGLRPAQAEPPQRDPRSLVVGAGDLRVPGARHRQRRDHRPLRHARAEGAVPAPAARGRDLLLLLDDRAAGRVRPDAVHDPGGEGRRRVDPRRLEVLLVERQDGRRSSSSWPSPTPTSAPTRACPCSWSRATRRASTSSATSASAASRSARDRTR